MRLKIVITICALVIFTNCNEDTTAGYDFKNPNFNYKPYTPKESDKVLSRTAYRDKLYGFWLGQCIANWTGLVTEMDKVGNIGNKKTGAFYTREDWGKPDQPNIWSDTPSEISETIDFVFEDEDGIWGADDDTDIEYMYQHLLFENETHMLTGAQIREGWLKHIKAEEENYLWVSNQAAFGMMLNGVEPPLTGQENLNPHYEMIDAQLTTEIFGLFAPTKPRLARKMAALPIRTTARQNAFSIANFYVTMHSLAGRLDPGESIKNQIFWLARRSKYVLPKGSYPAKMYDFVLGQYRSGVTWEQARDAVYERYQVNQKDGYFMTARNLDCNGCFAAGINFASSLISLFYGKGDLKETIKIGTLAGWDSDNPTATWGGLIGFMLGKEGVEQAFGRKFSNRFNIHRTRQNFGNDGIDTFESMAEKGVFIVDRVIQDQLGGGIDLEKGLWYIPTGN